MKQSERLQLVAFLAGICIVLLLLCLGCFVVVAGRNFNESVGPLIGYATPTVAMLFAYAGITAKLDKVHKQVNGNFTVLQEKNSALTDTLAEIATEQITTGKHAAPEEVN